MLTLAAALICCTVIVTLSVASALATTNGPVEPYRPLSNPNTKDQLTDNSQRNDYYNHPIPASQRPASKKKEDKMDERESLSIKEESLSRLQYSQRIDQPFRLPFIAQPFLRDDDPILKELELEDELQRLQQFAEHNLEDVTDHNFISRKKRSFHHNYR